MVSLRTPLDYASTRASSNGHSKRSEDSTGCGEDKLGGSAGLFADADIAAATESMAKLNAVPPILSDFIPFILLSVFNNSFIL